MRDIILQILKRHFQYNDYKLDNIANEIAIAIKTKQTIEEKQIVSKSCFNCIHRNTLMVTFVGENPNLCQRGRPKGDAINCPYYSEDIYGVKTDDGADYSSITRTIR